MASVSDGYVHIRVPPVAGPRVVSWMAMTARRPTDRSWQMKRFS